MADGLTDAVDKLSGAEMKRRKNNLTNTVIENKSKNTQKKEIDKTIRLALL